MNNVSPNTLKTPELPLRVVLPITSIGIVLAALDGSIVNVSLRTIQGELGTNEAGISWVVIAYLLTITSLMGLGGGLGDIYGRKKVFQTGMLIFSFGSLLCSLSDSLIMLVVSRIVQAVGAAGLMSNGLAIVITFINPKIRGRAIGINSLVVAGSLSTGPILGGILTEYAGWEWIFLINVPIGIIGFIATQLKIPETPRRDVKPDYLGILFFGLSILSLVSGMMLSFNDNLFVGIPVILLFFVFGILFIQQEARFPNPMLSIDVMKSRQISMGVISAIFLYLGVNGIFFLFPFFLQDIMLFSQSKTGLYMIVSPLAMSLVGPPAGFLAEKIPARKLATLGGILQTLVTLSLSLILINLGSSTSLLVIMVLAGLMSGSLSLFTNSNSVGVMNGTPPKMLSSVSGALNLSRNVGFTLGTSMTSVIFFGVFLPNLNKGGLSDGFQFKEAYYHGLGYTFLIISAIVLVGTIISSFRGEDSLVL